MLYLSYNGRDCIDDSDHWSHGRKRSRIAEDGMEKAISDRFFLFRKRRIRPMHRKSGYNVKHADILPEQTTQNIVAAKAKSKIEEAFAGAKTTGPSAVAGLLL